MKQAGRSGSRGFTLVELVIVVAIIAILASIAFPSYRDYTQRSRRAVAKTALLEAIQAKERFHTANNTYVGSPCPGVAEQYAIACSNLTATTFTVTATPQGAQTGDSCGALSITHTGAKSPSTGGCW